MQVIGYSEKGLLNSLFYEIKYSQNNLQLLNEFLSLPSFPYLVRGTNFWISDAEILIEQSFSDFGVADVVFLLNNQGNKQVIFMEAKVKTSQKSYGNFRISKEFEEFENERKKREPIKTFTSNLFVQLYFKGRLIKALQTGNVRQLENGMKFPACLLKKSRRPHERCMPRKIGNNEVIRKAVDKLKDYCKNAMFVALVPDDINILKDFYQNNLKDYNPEGFQEWDIKDWGYISWEQVKNFCEKNRLEETLKVFEFNKGQIY